MLVANFVQITPVFDRITAKSHIERYAFYS